MNITNSQTKTLEQIFGDIQRYYPNAKLKKQFLGPQVIMVPYRNFHFLLRNKNGNLKVDFTPPALWILGGILGSFALFTLIYSILFQQLMISIGGAIPIVLGLLVTKEIFRSTHKSEFETFQSEANVLVNTAPGNL
jgi:hypothetical protein